MADGKRQLLPKNVKPVHYKLELDPSFETFDIDGSTVIELEVLADSSEISLHKREIDILETKIIYSDGKVDDPESLQYNEDNFVLKIILKNLAPKGSKVKLSFKFKAQLNNNGQGFYRGTYNDDGKTKLLAATQFQAIDARRAFPCFDEPELKATFDITLIAAQEHTCLSNMGIIKSTDLENGRKKVEYAITPLMSTYLVAFSIGEFDFIESSAADFHVPVRIYAIPSSLKVAKYSLDFAIKVLKFYEEKFDIPFPLAKLDLIGLPESGGAMENWGLIIFTEALLLWDEKTGSALMQTFVSNSIAHEIAHQWFGNIVTMRYWDGLWLNEGFATWMAWYAMDHFYPDWNIWQQSVYQNWEQALRLDCIPSSHAVEVPVLQEKQINQIFDPISYQKGSCINQMLASWLGEEVFLKGIQVYLKRFLYGSTETKDLWKALAEVSGKDIQRIMPVWVEKPGFPLVTVSEHERGIRVSQKRFIKPIDAKVEDIIYPVFLALRTPKGVQNLILFEQEMEIPLADLSFYKLNANHNGLFRTFYPEDRVEKLGKAIADGLLTAEDRIGLISDVAALASTGHQKTTAFFNLLDNLSGETETLVWQQAISNLLQVQSAWYWQPQEIKEGLRAFTRKLIAPRLAEIGWDIKPDEQVMMSRQKIRLFEVAGLAGNSKIIEACKKMFASIAAGNLDEVNPKLRGSVWQIAVRHGSREDFETCLSLFRKSSTSQEDKNSLLSAMSRTQDPASIQEFLDLILTDEVGRFGVSNFALPSLHESSREAIWDWAQQKWPEIEAKYGEGLGGNGAVSYIIASLGTRERIEKGRIWFGSRDTSGFDLTMAQTFDGVESQIQWVERDQEDVTTWLKKKGYL